MRTRPGERDGLRRQASRSDDRHADAQKRGEGRPRLASLHAGSVRFLMEPVQ